VFLAEMATVVPWAALEGVIEPHYPKTGAQGGRRPFPLAVMLRFPSRPLKNIATDSIPRI
jgi:hypothetical protein